MEDTKNKSLHALRSSGAERIFEAYKWVNDLRHEFNKDVYGPVLIEVNVKDRVHANYLEGHVAHYIWKNQLKPELIPDFYSFTVEEKEGSGGYGTVYKANRKQDGLTFAIKCKYERFK